MNYVLWLQRKIDDPNTSRENYMRYWQEMQDILHRQAVINEMAAKRVTSNQPA